MIRNYPGFPYGISGHELTRRACEQAWMFGAHMVFAQPAIGLEERGGDRVVRVADGSEVTARTVILAPGIAWRRPRSGQYNSVLPRGGRGKSLPGCARGPSR